MDLFARLTIDPAVRFGKPCVRGTRLTVGDVLACLAFCSSRRSPSNTSGTTDDSATTTSRQGQQLLTDMMKTDQRWCLPFLEMAVHRIPELLMQVLQGERFGGDGRADPTGPIGTILGLFHKEQDSVPT